jgi:hypothetical protein
MDKLKMEKKQTCFAKSPGNDPMSLGMKKAKSVMPSMNR